MKKYTEDELRDLDDKTDYERLKDMSEDEVEKNSETDADALTPADCDFEKFRRVHKDEKQ